MSEQELKSQYDKLMKLKADGQKLITEIELAIIRHREDDKNTQELCNTLFEWRQKNFGLVKEKQRIEHEYRSNLPVVLEGYAAENEEEVDSDERGVLVQIYSFLGCPYLDNKRRQLDTIKYDGLRDLSEIIREHDGKFLRITIEQVDDLNDRKRCQDCELRFKCLTTRK